jgi:hypothetical protein
MHWGDTLSPSVKASSCKVGEFGNKLSMHNAAYPDSEHKDPTPITQFAESVGPITGSYMAEITVPGQSTITISVAITGDDEGSDYRTICPVKISLDSVNNADYIDTDGSNCRVYATAKAATGNVEIILAADPPAATLPDRFVNWSGGTAASSQLKRLLAKQNLQSSGVPISASAGSSTTIKTKTYVFPEAPSTTTLATNVSLKQDTTLTIADDSTVGVFNGPSDAMSPNDTYDIYYANKSWKFMFKSVTFDAKYNVDGHGRGDVTSGNLDPFPLGRGMNEDSTQAERKAQAKSDLTPCSDPVQMTAVFQGNSYTFSVVGAVPGIAYWSSAMATQHETKHFTDWYPTYYACLVTVKTWVEQDTQAVAVTLQNLDPATVLAGQKNSFNTMLMNCTMTANLTFWANGNAEVNAYADGKQGYQALANSIQ